MIDWPTGKYRTIYVDPPWPERGGRNTSWGKAVAPSHHYDVMPFSQILDLPVASLKHESGCHLYLWATNTHLEKALEVVRAWGFRYVTTITWFKERIGLGQYFRNLTEHCLFCVHDSLPLKKDAKGKRQQGVTGFYAPRAGHSQKPEEMRRLIEIVSYHPYLELFARSEIAGWDTWGNEVGKIAMRQRVLLM